ncbi:MAG: preprotein translocase subunit YajC [Lachnospiraceae bacterium]|nr:preprotein translocase subunit YajC [Lachnospiraceae bacterium]
MIVLLAKSGAGAAGGNAGQGGLITMILLYAIIFGVFWYFVIRPQNKQRKEHDALLTTLEVGDSILTTSGFFGVVIDITDEIVIVEFGSNKNCRIPMKKENIVEIDKQSGE